MKQMTCKQLGGPCDFELRGTTADDVIKAFHDLAEAPDAYWAERAERT